MILKSNLGNNMTVVTHILFDETIGKERLADIDQNTTKQVSRLTLHQIHSSKPNLRPHGRTKPYAT